MLIYTYSSRTTIPQFLYLRNALVYSGLMIKALIYLIRQTRSLKLISKYGKFPLFYHTCALITHLDKSQSSHIQEDWISCYALCFLVLSYLVRIIVLYLYSASILYHQHFLLTGHLHLPKITKILILTSLTAKYHSALPLTILRQTFSWLIAFVPIDSP